ncbi:TPA: 8-amino-7-oxononanoate synthase [Candidatus Gastranaerophilales bacterium HUM_20]|nr:8-amino-7-oxononanoate synthase [Clostridium sp. CAG:729]DAB22862.1 MAG TPA: 8-amino-7-oxononanoate synthase [Candidatus Gastranaerophilales bacterium HUM_20]
MLEDYNEILEDLKKHSHFRNIKNFENKDEKYIYFNGKKLINLSSNNYLGLADNKRITEAFFNSGGDKYSFGSASARLLTGTLPVYKELEKLISRLFKTDKTLLFNSGYHANVGINSSLASGGDVIFSDKLNHASIIDGMQLSKAKFFRYRHNDMENLENFLIKERKNFKNAIIVSESVFSMDGDIADLRKLVELKQKYNCILVLDEAHAFGVFGKTGLGVCENLEITDKVDLIVGTFGKAIGSMGAFATGKKELIEYLINKARSFIFSTALPPVNIAFSKFIIENELPKTYDKRMRMLELGRKAGSESHIIPVVIGGNKETVDTCEVLFHNGYFTLPIRPPTVPERTSRLRISLTTEINEKELFDAISLAKQTK